MSSFKATILDLKGIHLSKPPSIAEDGVDSDPSRRLKVTFESHGEVLHTIFSKPLVQQSSSNGYRYKAVFPKSSIILPAIESVATPVSSCSSEAQSKLDISKETNEDGLVFHVKASVIFDDDNNNKEQYIGSTVLNVDSNVETNSVLMMILPVKRGRADPETSANALDSPVALNKGRTKSFVGKFMKRTRSLSAVVRSPSSVMHNNLNDHHKIEEEKYELSEDAQLRIKFKMVEDETRPKPRSHAEYLAQLRDLSRAAHNDNSGNENQGEADGVSGTYSDYDNSLVSSKDYESNDDDADNDNDTEDNVSRQSCTGPSLFEAFSNFMCAPGGCGGGIDVDMEVDEVLRNVDSYGSSTQDSRFVPAVEDGYWERYEFDDVSMLTEPTLTE